MKIVQILPELNLSITNEESSFVKKFGNSVKISSLDEHSQWVAQNLVRKGVYSISNDNNTLIKQIHETN
jgi:ribosomal protein RSM22 (predicted rRNA methylase)